MSITITTRLERRIEANPRVLTIIETIRGNRIQAALTPDEARQIAAALTADQGGQWTRNDLPSEDDFQWEMFESRFGQFDGYRSPAKQHDLYTVFKSGIQYGQSRDLDHLNAHHPKPDSPSVIEDEVRRRTEALRENLRGKAMSTDLTRVDIEKALRECTNDVFASHAYPHMADAVCALFGIEAEQAVDPIEEKARVLWEAGRANPLLLDDQPANVRETFRRVAEYVLGQEADHA